MQHFAGRTSTLRRRMVLLTALSVLTFAGLGLLHAGTAAAGTNGCRSDSPAAFTACSAPVVSGSTATFTFTLSAPLQVSAVSFVIPGTNVVAPGVYPQVLWDSTTQSLGAGTWTLSVALPGNSCSYQLDLISGTPSGAILNGPPGFPSSQVATYGFGPPNGKPCGVIEVKKQTDPAGAPDTFQFTGALTGLIGDGGSIKQAEPAGTYSTTENVPSGWSLTSITCSSDGAAGGSASGSGATATYNLVAGELLSCTYLDTKQTEQLGQQGCTPGYWKQPQHLDSWQIYAPTQSFASVFGVQPYSPAPTLLSALGQGGGGVYALGRQAVAALLNAASTGVAYPITSAQVISMTYTAITSGNATLIENTKDTLEGYNTLGCPLN